MTKSVQGLDCGAGHLSIAAARAGLRPGDWLVGINGSPINANSDIDPFVKDRGGGRPITVDIERGATHLQVRASPPNGRWQRGVLGITGTEFFFGRGEPSPYIEPQVQPLPIPTPPPDPPPIPPPQVQ